MNTNQIFENKRDAMLSLTDVEDKASAIAYSDKLLRSYTLGSISIMHYNLLFNELQLQCLRDKLMTADELSVLF